MSERTRTERIVASRLRSLAVGEMDLPNGRKAMDRIVAGFHEDGETGTSEATLLALRSAGRWELELASRIVDYLGLDDALEVTLEIDVLEDLADYIASVAHEGQVDKAGRPYIEHPRAVAELVSPYGATARIIASLHDTVEDTWVTLDFLRLFFPGHIVAAVDALTKREGEPKDDYYARVALNDEATLVKTLGDIPHNSDPKRLSKLNLNDQIRLGQKYDHALRAITAERARLGKRMP